MHWKEELNNLEPCPKCGGKIRLYSCCCPDTDYDSFARCTACKTEIPIRGITLAANGTRIYPSSIKKVIRHWNRIAKTELLEVSE